MSDWEDELLSVLDDDYPWDDEDLDIDWSCDLENPETCEACD